MYYTVYKITNLINNKIYIGVHKTKDINDNYMGSGKILKMAQEKYGIENFKKEILEVFDNAEDMFNMESQLVNEEFIKDKETYNLKIGGHGGFDHLKEYINSETQAIHLQELNKKYSQLGIEKIKFLIENDKVWLENKTKQFIKTIEEKYKNGYNNPFKNKKHTEETKKKISEANSKHQKGKGNSQFGTIWIYNLEEKLSKKIKKEELPNFEKMGWLKGRKMKF
jgi:group I intron endonuclease